MAHRLPRVSKNITVILLEAGVVTPEQVEFGVLRQRETGLRIGETLVEMGVVTEEDVGWALSRQLGLTFADIDPVALDPGLVRAFHETVLRRCDAVPLVRVDGMVTLAVADPTDDKALERLESVAGARLSLVIGTPTAIRRALDHVFGPAPAALGPTVSATPLPPAPNHPRLYDVVWERSGDTFLAFHVASARQLGAREIHFVTRGGQLHVLMRQGRALVESAVEPIHMIDSVLARVEALGGPVADSLHVEGRFQCPLPFGEVTLDASLLTTSEGTQIVLVLPPEPPGSGAPIAALEGLGVDPTDAAELREALSLGAGLLLLGGPRGSGGSSLLTALAAAGTPPGARVLAIAVTSSGAAPAGGTRLLLPRDEAAAAWPGIAAAQRADVVLLDGVLDGAAIDGVLDGAVSRRLVLVRTDWADTQALLERLLAQPGARSVLARRLLAVVQSRRVDATPPLLVETLIGDSLRTTLEKGHDIGLLFERAAGAGFRTLLQRGADRVEANTLDDRELRRALT